MQIRLANGVWYNAVSAVLSGAGVVTTVTATGTALIFGWALVALGVSLFVWGVRINDKHIWQRWWRLAETNTRPDRMMPFVTLRELALECGIPLPRFGEAQNNAYYIEGALQQAAVRGLLRVEGRQYRGAVRHNDPLVPIPSDHFRDYGFGHGVLNYEANNDVAHTGNIDMLVHNQAGIEGVTFYDLHLSEHDARNVLSELEDPRIVRS